MQLDHNYLEISSRIRSAITPGEAPSAAASCNTFVVEDSVNSKSGIAAAVAWSLNISYWQGAPTLILSNLRGRNEPLSTGGTASGPCSFARIFDICAEVMRRPTKKNGVAVAFLDANHPDILEWISPQFKGSLDRLYTGVLFRDGVTYPPSLLEAIAKAYDTWSVSYLCKVIRDPETGDDLYPNVCTEIRQKHKGQCILGVIKLHELPTINPRTYADDLAVWRSAFSDSVAEMVGYLEIAKRNSQQYPDLFSYEPQVGLGFVGFANILGKFGATYEGLSRYLEIVKTVSKMEEEYRTYETLLNILARHAKNQTEPDPSLVFLTALITGLQAGTEVGYTYRINRLWTQQPTTHTSLRLTDGGYSVAAEIQPPYAVRGGDGLSRSRQISSLRGDTELLYAESVETRDEVPYEVYRRVSCLIQYLFDFSGMAHTLSHCYYGDKFTVSSLRTFLSSPLLSLYYRLPSTPASTYTKDSVPGDVGTLESVALGEDEFLSALGSAVIDPEPGVTCPVNAGNDCEVCSM